MTFLESVRWKAFFESGDIFGQLGTIGQFGKVGMLLETEASLESENMF